MKKSVCKKGFMPRRGLVLIAFLAMLAVAGTASADTVALSLYDFAIFSGGGTYIAGANLVYGNVGSNQDLSITAGDTQILGSAYAGGNLNTGSNVAFGSDGITSGPAQEIPPFNTAPVYPARLSEVVVNGTADIQGSGTPALASRIYGNLYTNDVYLRQNASVRMVSGTGGNMEYTGTFSRNSGASVQGLVNGVVWGPALSASNPSAPAALGSTKTFGAIAMTSGVSFTATGANQQVNASLDFLQLAPGSMNTYGALSTSEQSQTVRLSSGDYYFSAITAQGAMTLEIDLSSGQPININVVSDAVFGQDAVLKVKGPGMTGYVPISQAPELAALINWKLGGKFDLGGGDADAWTTIFGGIVYSAFDGAGDGVIIDQHVDWYGALYAYDTVNLADHSRFNSVNPVPIPAAFYLLGSGLLGLVAIRRRMKK